MRSDSNHKKARVTLKDVAAACGVHLGTVSAILHSTRSGTRFSKELEDLVRQTAKDLRYTPHVGARTLRGKRSEVLSLWCPKHYTFKDPFYSKVFQAVAEGCALNQRHLSLPFGYTELTWNSFLDWGASGGIDGLICMESTEYPEGLHLAQQTLRVAMVNQMKPGFPSFCPDYTQSGILAAEHLWARGHRKVLYSCVFSPAVSILFRRLGFMRRFTELGGATELIEPSVRGNSYVDASEEVLAKMGGRVGATAIICWNDTFAYGLIGNLRAKGVNAPAEFGLMGFDHTPPKQSLEYVLTTVDTRIDQACLLAVESLCHPKVEKPEQIFLEPRLIVGTTT